MHCKRNSILSLLLAISVATIVRAQKYDSIFVKLSMPKSEINFFGELSLTLRIMSGQERALEIPKGALWGYYSEGPSFFSIQTQKKIDGKYKNIKGNTRFDYPAEVDIDTLRKNDVREFKYQINRLYSYNRGLYRVRVLCHFSTINPVGDKFSNWTCFYCNRAIRP